MNQNDSIGNILRTPVPYGGESNVDYRARIAAHQAEAVERRQLELREQCSPMTAPASRIRIWERLHQVDLPRSVSHRLIDVIASQTGLTSEEVRHEQRVRAAPPVPMEPTAT